MKIAILLPYKENFTKNNAGAVSIFVNDTNQLSNYKNKIKVYGSTEKKNKINNNTNIILKKNILSSTSNQYLKNFAKIISHEDIDILEIHNRPHYIDYLDKISRSKKFFLMIIKMQGQLLNEK